MVSLSLVEGPWREMRYRAGWPSGKDTYVDSAPPQNCCEQSAFARDLYRFVHTVKLETCCSDGTLAWPGQV